jgi:hypothetical protein
MFQLYVKLNNGDRKSFIFKSLEKAKKIKNKLEGLGYTIIYIKSL